MKEHEAIKLQDDPEKWVDEDGKELVKCPSEVSDVLTIIDNLLYPLGLELHMSETLYGENIELLGIKQGGR